MRTIEGTVPSAYAMPQGCRFHPRCVFSVADCQREQPALRPLGSDHLAACIRAPLEAAVAAESL